jgi:hypothetical protein
MNIKHPLQEPIQRLRPTSRWSDATIFNGIAHFVEVAIDTEQDMTSQTTQLLSQAEVTLAAVGSDNRNSFQQPSI